VAPINNVDAGELIRDFDRVGNFTGTRGQTAWDRKEAIRSIMAMSTLLRSSREWVLSVDINPLMRTSDGFVAVDALVLVRP
jgi:hypothetical protein